MKNTVEAEDLRNLNYEPFHEPLSGAMELASEPGDIFLIKESSEGKFLDLLLSVIKWVFLFLPGAAVIHFIMLGFALLYFYDDWSFGLVGASAGLLVFGTFMAMLGIGKLRDLRYLRVPASIFVMGGLASILYSILIVFLPGDYFGIFAQLTLPLTVFVGYMVKRDTDKNLELELAGLVL